MLNNIQGKKNTRLPVFISFLLLSLCGCSSPELPITENKEGVSATESQQSIAEKNVSSDSLHLTDEAIQGFPEPQTKGQIISSGPDEKTGLYKWTLENGVDVWFKRMPEAKKKVYIRYTAKGGNLLLPPELKPAFDFTIETFMRSGLAHFDAVQLNNYLTEKKTFLRPEIYSNQRTLAVTTNQDNLLTAFSSLHQAATTAKVDPSQFKAIRHNIINQRQSYLTTPFSRYVQALNTTLYGESNPLQLATVEQLKNATADQVDQVYQLSFRQQDSFKLIIVADMQPEVFEPYLQQYIANISYNPGVKSRQKVELLTDQSHVVLKANDQPTTVSDVLFSSVASARMTTEHLFSYHLISKMLAKRLSNRLNGKICQDTPPTVGIVTPEATNVATLYFNITTAPEDKPKVDSAINDVLSESEKGFTEEELNIAKAQLLTELDKEVNNPKSQAFVLMYYLASGYDVNAYYHPKAFLHRLTTEKVHKIYTELTGKHAHRLDASLTPKEKSLN
ncbi:hypothetical protein DI392_14295 [Vibrio albus]|uniref:Peptidase M16 C-terminal domain-containing protein n=1 Tax=Vibrio albus TaxID=2200953 RepID=A0A2U3B731_9VIBR|nr:insulinase family protein [Vibrio albus]PWI32588.1 hypothetical protein DI392_14295 [Vibrio albus]